MRRKLTTAVVILGAAAFLVPGVWALLDLGSFHEHVARFDPFNLHLLHDVGAFQIGVGVAPTHAVSHIADRDLGDRASDPWVLSLLAVLLGAALVLHRRAAHQARKHRER